MLPIFTTGQIKDGVDAGDFMIDLSDYLKKKDGATKTELQTLTEVVASKLDASPQHKHDMRDIKDLREVLEGKFDTSQKYSYNVILSDSEKIPYLEAPKIETLELAANSESIGYKFYVDDSSGDLMVVSDDDILIATYIKSTGNWRFGGLTDVLDNHYEALNAVCHATLININNIEENKTKITSMENVLNEYIAKTDAILKNHYDALLVLCEKHGMVDGDGDAGNNITPV